MSVLYSVKENCSLYEAEGGREGRERGRKGGKRERGERDGERSRKLDEEGEINC